MSRDLKQIIPPQQLGAGTSLLYTVPLNRSTVVTRISLINTSSEARFVNIWFVPNGSVPADDNKIVDNLFVSAQETFSPPDVEGQVLPSQNTIQAQAEVATAITIIGSGTEVTN